ncbi:hypothetical protein SNOUR_01440 [Streptomyces noursei ATCC 11455]|nr:hypothetical protein SNOUR_01440 [Streptomyces noursei ATCC 11455]
MEITPVEKTSLSPTAQIAVKEVIRSRGPEITWLVMRCAWWRGHPRHPRASAARWLGSCTARRLEGVRCRIARTAGARRRRPRDRTPGGDGQQRVRRAQPTDDKDDLSSVGTRWWSCPQGLRLRGQAGGRNVAQLQDHARDVRQGVAIHVVSKTLKMDSKTVASTPTQAPSRTCCDRHSRSRSRTHFSLGPSTSTCAGRKAAQTADGCSARSSSVVTVAAAGPVLQERAAHEAPGTPAVSGEDEVALPELLDHGAGGRRATSGRTSQSWRYWRKTSSISASST